MAFVRVAWFPGAQEHHFRTLAAAMGDVSAPPGRILFAAGPATGGWQVVQVWESRRDLDEFNQRHFFPAIARLGDSFFPEPPVVVDVDTVALEVR